MFTEISSPLVSQILPNLSMWIWYAIIFGSAILIFIVTYLYFGSRICAYGFAFIPVLFGLIIQVIPLWTILPFMTFGAYSVLFHTEQIAQPIPESQDIDAWSLYGNKLKQAYSAKFGGENTGFNEEVDKRIAVMQNLKRGFTHTISRDWLKRMARFTEVK